MRFSTFGFVLAFTILSSVNGQNLPEKSPSERLPRHPIVFVNHSDASRKDYDIWQVAADGTQLASVIVRPNHQSEFAISPDGQELIYVDLVDGKRDLFRSKYSGKDRVNLTKNPANDFSPAWSPNGNHVIFTSDRDHPQREVYMMSLKTAEVTRVTKNNFHEGGGSWAPDGTKIIFTRYFPGNEKEKSSGQGVIIEHDLKTGKERKLTKLNGYCGGADYSPDGRKIAFHRSTEKGSELWIMNNDGSQPVALTNTFIDEYSPAWAPDGNWIAYTAGTGNDGQGTFDLWLIRPDGSGNRVVSKAANTQMSPSWRPGKHFLQ